MFYAKYNLLITEPHTLRDVIKYCPYGILNVKNEDDEKLAVLVRVYYSDVNGLSFRIAHNYKVLIEELLRGDVSLKLCNREMNIYIVADVRISPPVRNGLLNKAYLKGAGTIFKLFTKNKSEQLTAFNSAV